MLVLASSSSKRGLKIFYVDRVCLRRLDNVQEGYGVDVKY